jgi:hypothetical protein
MVTSTNGSNRLTEVLHSAKLYISLLDDLKKQNFKLELAVLETF